MSVGRGISKSKISIIRICSLLQESVSIICSRVFTFLLKSIKVIEPVFWSWKSKFWLWETLFVMLRPRKNCSPRHNQTSPRIKKHTQSMPTVWISCWYHQLSEKFRTRFSGHALGRFLSKGTRGNLKGGVSPYMKEDGKQWQQCQS